MLVIAITGLPPMRSPSPIFIFSGPGSGLASGAVPASVKKLIAEEIIKKDDVVVGILTGRQKDAGIPVDYHKDSKNKFANPPKS